MLYFILYIPYDIDFSTNNSPIQTMIHIVRTSENPCIVINTTRYRLKSNADSTSLINTLVYRQFFPSFFPTTTNKQTRNLFFFCEYLLLFTPFIIKLSTNQRIILQIDSASSNQYYKVNPHKLLTFHQYSHTVRNIQKRETHCFRNLSQSCSIFYSTIFSLLLVHNQNRNLHQIQVLDIPLHSLTLSSSFSFLCILDDCPPPNLQPFLFIFFLKLSN